METKELSAEFAEGAEGADKKRYLRKSATSADSKELL
jgi:hypothetical protein